MLKISNWNLEEYLSYNYVDRAVNRDRLQDINWPTCSLRLAISTKQYNVIEIAEEPDK